MGKSRERAIVATKTMRSFIPFGALILVIFQLFVESQARLATNLDQNEEDHFDEETDDLNPQTKVQCECFNDYEFMVTPTSTTFDSATTACNVFGYELVDWETFGFGLFQDLFFDAMNGVIKSSSSNLLWIGMKKQGLGNTYYWLDGTPYNKGTSLSQFAEWGDGNKECVYLSYDSDDKKILLTDSCESMHHYGLCQKKTRKC